MYTWMDNLFPLLYSGKIKKKKQKKLEQDINIHIKAASST